MSHSAKNHAKKKTKILTKRGGRVKATNSQTETKVGARDPMHPIRDLRHQKTINQVREFFELQK